MFNDCWFCCQECTTVFVSCLDWWEIRCCDTTGTRYPVVALLCCLLGVPWCLCTSSLSASVRILLGPFWFTSARPLVSTSKRTDEGGDPCGRPIMRWWGAELQFPSCITTVLSRSAPAILLHKLIWPDILRYVTVSDQIYTAACYCVWPDLYCSNAVCFWADLYCSKTMCVSPHNYAWHGSWTEVVKGPLWAGKSTAKWGIKWKSQQHKFFELCYTWVCPQSIMYKIGHEIPNPTRGKRGRVT